MGCGASLRCGRDAPTELRSLGERITCAAMTERAMVPFREYLSAFPLVAILRGLRPDNAAAIGEALVEGEFLSLIHI